MKILLIILLGVFFSVPRVVQGDNAGPGAVAAGEAGSPDAEAKDLVSPQGLSINPQRLQTWGSFINEGLKRPEIKDEAVLKAMSRVPRHEFVAERQAREAYSDYPLAIDKGQTISQPFIVAFMTQEAGIKPGSKVLEIGTGSGYQAAVLAELGAKVVSIEIIPELARSAESRLQKLGYGDLIKVVTGDGAFGYQALAPYDAIIVTAACPRVPPQLLEQLASGGRMVIPIQSTTNYSEDLMLYERSGDKITGTYLLPVAFVPLTGSEGEE